MTAKRPSAGTLWVVAGFAVFCAIYLNLAWYRLHAMLLGFDTGTFLQMLENFATTGSTFETGEMRPHLAVHDSWTLLLFSPLVRLWPFAQTLMVIQVIVIAAAVFPLYAFGRHVGLGDRPAAAIALAWLISPSVQGFAFGNFIENHVAPLLIFAIALAARTRSLAWTLVFAELLMGVKEDEIFFVAWFALASVAFYDKRLGWAALGLAALNGVAYYGLERLYGFVPYHPGYGLTVLDPWQHVAFFLEILAPFAFAPLWLGRAALLAVPLVYELSFNARYGQSLAHAGVHYSEPIVALIALATMLVARRRPIFGRLALPCSLVMVAFFNTTVFRIGRHEYPPDWPAYHTAMRAATDGRRHDFTVDDEAGFALAAGNLRAVYHDEHRAAAHARPGWYSRVTPRVDLAPGPRAARPAAI